MLFAEVPMLERPALAAAAGFGAIEIQFPYDLALDDLVRAKEDAGLEMALINLGVVSMERGGPGLAAMPGLEGEFDTALEQALEYAEGLRPANVNVLAGWPPPEIPRSKCLEVLEGNLAKAAEAFQNIGIGVVLEAINTRDRPGFLVYSSNDAMEIIGRVGHPNLGLQYDLYHMQIMEGDLAPTMARLKDHIFHIQFADTPGRHEPGTGEINFPFIFVAIDAMGYEGWVGAEYVPSGASEDSLGWLAPYIS